jgi:hypothetical protein
MFMFAVQEECVVGDADADTDGSESSAPGESKAPPKKPTFRHMMRLFQKPAFAALNGTASTTIASENDGLDHLGYILGCMKDEKGNQCASRDMCELFTSCCGVAFSKLLADVFETPMDEATVAEFEAACPGSEPYITGKEPICS